MPLMVADVVLRYDCRACRGFVKATIQLSGELEGPEGPYCVKHDLKCPNCDCFNEVVFDVEGDVRIVTARVFADPIWN